MYEKKSKVSACIIKKQVVENLYYDEIDIVYECFFRVYLVCDNFFAAKSEHEIG